jgi:hypothetical protein
MRTQDLSGQEMTYKVLEYIANNNMVIQAGIIGSQLLLDLDYCYNYLDQETTQLIFIFHSH